MRAAVQRLLLGGLAGKLLGLLREVLLAAAYGTGAPAVANRVAQSATLVPVDLLTADVLTSGFLPLHARLRHADPARAAALFHRLRAALWVLAAVLTGGLLVAAPLVVDLLAPGLGAGTAATATAFVRTSALGVPSYLQFALLSCLEVSHGSFRLSSLRATGQNAGALAALGLAWWLGEPLVLAGGFALAYLLLHAWAEVSLRRRGLLPARPASGSGAGLPGELWRRLRPLLLLPLALQASVVAERVVASLMGEDVVAAVDYARFVATTGVNLLAVPLGLAGLAVLSTLAADAARERLAQLLPPLLLVVAALSVVLTAEAAGVVEVLYARGAFDDRAVATSASVLAGLGAGFWAQSVSYVLVKALTAQDRNRAAATSLLAGLVVALAVNVCLHDVLGPVVLGLATSAGAVVSCAVAAARLGVGRVLVRWGAACLPVAALSWLAAACAPGSGWAGLAVGAACALGVWVLAALALPPWRRVAAGVLRG
ncbi:lipid II flippase MurJ [Kineococcus sp. SYSU DK006]|uniref:lipid II flippase MurJ n=1 Tax=Kineococcus sp. SYSU DK006 TaxID=3383127 RepID=UPI003D7DC3F2